MARSMFFLLVGLVCFGTHYLFAQEKNPSIKTVSPIDTTMLKGNSKFVVVQPDTLEEKPNMAMMYSAVLPGLGQVYNKKYWKLPLLYGGGVALAYFIHYNNKLYVQYRNSLIALKDGDPRTQPLDTRYDQQTYERVTDYWRRNRDLVILSTMVVYLLNIVDANVDAELADFKISDDLAFRVEPSVEQTAMATNIIGLSIKLKLNQ